MFLYEKVLLKISHNLQEKTCGGVYELQAVDQKRDFELSYESCTFFKNAYFVENLWMVASVFFQMFTEHLQTPIAFFLNYSQRKKCPYWELIWSVFSHIWTG